MNSSTDFLKEIRQKQMFVGMFTPKFVVTSPAQYGGSPIQKARQKRTSNNVSLWDMEAVFIGVSEQVRRLTKENSTRSYRTRGINNSNGICVCTTLTCLKSGILYIYLLQYQLNIKKKVIFLLPNTLKIIKLVFIIQVLLHCKFFFYCIIKHLFSPTSSFWVITPIKHDLHL